jgi:hypothetical protein
MKTICVGRFLVDVPAQAEVSLSREMTDGFDIETIEEDDTTFRERVAARETGIGALDAPSFAKGGGEMVEARDLRLPGLVGRLLVYGRTRSPLATEERNRL